MALFTLRICRIEFLITIMLPKLGFAHALPASASRGRKKASFMAEFDSNFVHVTLLQATTLL
jgi:hypothetical protein